MRRSIRSSLTRRIRCPSRWRCSDHRNSTPLCAILLRSSFACLAAAAEHFLKPAPWPPFDRSRRADARTPRQSVAEPSGSCMTARRGWRARRWASPRRRVSRLSKSVSTIRLPWAWLPPALWLFAAAGGARDGQRDWPRPGPIWSSACGRNTARPALAIRRASGGRTLAAQIQDPGVGRSEFDLLVVPEHDRLRGARVMVTRGAVHRVTAARLAAERGGFRRSRRCRGRSSRS